MYHVKAVISMCLLPCRGSQSLFIVLDFANKFLMFKLCCSGDNEIIIEMEDMHFMYGLVHERSKLSLSRMVSWLLDSSIFSSIHQDFRDSGACLWKRTGQERLQPGSTPDLEERVFQIRATVYLPF
jgi:hypothetical protein